MTTGFDLSRQLVYLVVFTKTWLFFVFTLKLRVVPILTNSFKRAIELLSGTPITRFGWSFMVLIVG